MRIILLERIPKLGRIGDVVTVRDGYARNYLLPRHRALPATTANIAYFETRREEIEARNLRHHAAAEEVAEALEGKVMVSIQKAGESGQLYGSVNAREIARLLAEQNLSIHHNQVVLDTPIKNLGLHEVTVNLHGDIFATVLVNAARNEEEAAHQLSAAKVKAKNEAKSTHETPEAPQEGALVAKAKADEPLSGQADELEQAVSAD